MSDKAAFEIGRLYLQLKRIADTLTAAQKDVFIRLPGLQAYFPMSIVDELGKSRDHAGGVDLFMTGTVLAGFDGNSYRQLGGGTNYFQVFSAVYDLTGTETFIDSALRGFTIGCWVNPGAIGPNVGGIISKDGIATNRGYSMYMNTAGNVVLRLSSNGTAIFTVASVGALSVGAWHFVVARFSPSVEMAVFVDGQKTALTASVPASCFASTQAFEVGREFNTDTRIITAKTRDMFLCRTILSDALIEEIRVASVP